MLSPLAVLFASSFTIWCLAFSPRGTFAFQSSSGGILVVQRQHDYRTHQQRLPTTRLAVVDVAGSNNNNNDDFEPESSTKGVQSRRRMMSTIAAGVLTSGLVTQHIKHAFAGIAYAANDNVANAATTTLPNTSSSVFGTADRPVAIVGGSGRTGMAVAESLADPAFGNMHAVTLSRSGRDPFQIVKLPQATKENLRHQTDPFDVRASQDTVAANLRAVAPSVVVYAASASRQGGNVFQVDDEGVEKVAQACKDIGALFVLISALAVDRPDSKSYQMTNTLGGNYQGIMDAKNHGEAKTREIFSSGGDYVIVRPGVLLGGKSLAGPAGLELNQGDTIGGGLSRDELAGIVVGAIQSKALANSNKTKNKRKGGEGITVEAYRKSTAQTLEKKYPLPSGNELAVDASLVATTPKTSSRVLYRELFAKAKSDPIV